jgi:hypothetical protein
MRLHDAFDEPHPGHQLGMKVFAALVVGIAIFVGSYAASTEHSVNQPPGQASPSPSPSASASVSPTPYMLPSTKPTTTM